MGAFDLGAASFQSVIDGGFSPRYVPTGHLVYVKGGNLMGVAFDPVKLETRGRALPVVAGLRIARRSKPSFDFSANGTLVYVSGPPATLSHLVWADKQGGVAKLPLPPQFYGDFQISPDGRYVAAMVGGDQDDVWIFEMERGTRRKLNTDGDAAHPIWSPDGKYVAFGSRRGETYQTYIRPVDGSEPARSISPEGIAGSPYALSGHTYGALNLWDWVAGEELRSLKSEGGNTLSVEILANGNWIVTRTGTAAEYLIGQTP